jgi:hypothetical protein
VMASPVEATIRAAIARNKVLNRVMLDLQDA